MQGNDEFMRIAIQLATNNVLSGRGGPFGAVIVREDEIVATGVNLVTTTNDPTAHAEVTAIREACRKFGAFELKGCSIYSSCEPCPMCLAAILWARFDALYFGNTASDAAVAGFDDARFYEQICRAPADRVLPSTNMMREEASQSFAAWSTSAGRIDY